MERVMGVEPTTSTLARLRSTTELHPQTQWKYTDKSEKCKLLFGPICYFYNFLYHKPSIALSLENEFYPINKHVSINIGKSKKPILFEK